MKYTVTEDQTLLDAVGLMSPDSSKTTLRSWIKEGRISINGEIEKIATTPVKKGEQISLGVKPRFASPNLPIYYEDKHIVVIEKPPGLLSVAAAFEKGKTAHALLKEYYRPKRVFVVHRIDQETSGVMLFALTEEARDGLKEIFEKHDIKREYIAIVEGSLDETMGTWQSYLYEDERYVVHSTKDPNKGQIAITHFELLDKNKRFSALKLTLETGRKNQIRVHCRDAGIPIVGDKKYGATTDSLKRLCLHAHLLSFKHPITKKELEFISPIPENFNQLVPLKASRHPK